MGTRWIGDRERRYGERVQEPQASGCVDLRTEQVVGLAVVTGCPVGRRVAKEARSLGSGSARLRAACRNWQQSLGLLTILFPPARHRSIPRRHLPDRRLAKRGEPGQPITPPCADWPDVRIGRGRTLGRVGLGEGAHAGPRRTSRSIVRTSSESRSGRERDGGDGDQD